MLNPVQGTLIKLSYERVTVISECVVVWLAIWNFCLVNCQKSNINPKPILTSPLCHTSNIWIWTRLSSHNCQRLLSNPAERLHARLTEGRTSGVSSEVTTGGSTSSILAFSMKPNPASTCFPRSLVGVFHLCHLVCSVGDALNQWSIKTNATSLMLGCTHAKHYTIMTWSLIWWDCRA